MESSINVTWDQLTDEVILSKREELAKSYSILIENLSEEYKSIIKEPLKNYNSLMVPDLHKVCLLNLKPRESADLMRLLYNIKLKLQLDFTYKKLHLHPYFINKVHAYLVLNG